jgi:hypothetical protein
MAEAIPLAVSGSHEVDARKVVASPVRNTA